MSHLPPSQNEVFRPRAGPQSERFGEDRPSEKEPILGPFLISRVYPGPGGWGSFRDGFGTILGPLGSQHSNTLSAKGRFREGIFCKEP